MTIAIIRHPVSFTTVIIVRIIIIYYFHPLFGEIGGWLVGLYKYKGKRLSFFQASYEICCYLGTLEYPFPTKTKDFINDVSYNMGCIVLCIVPSCIKVV